MSVTQYVGARYVPVFSNPIDWDITKSYEALTIVYYQGNSYTSRQAVPSNTNITNEDFWALTGNYNAQIEQYRGEVSAYDGKINENKTNIVAETTRATAAETALDGKIAVINTDVDGKAPKSHASLSSEYGVGTPTRYGHLRISDEVSNTNGVDVAITPKGAYDTATKLVQEGVQPIHDYIDGKFPVDTTDIKDNAVTTAKVANSSVTRDKLSGILPIKKADISPLSVGSEQLDSTAVNAILSQLTVRWFDSTNPAADNAGLIAETGTRIKGFYIPAIKMLVIQDCDADAVDREKNIAWTLPNYIPNVVSEQGVKFAGLVYNSDNDFVSWGRLVLNTKGVIYTDVLSAYSGGGTSFSSGTCVYFLHDAVGAQLASSGYEAAKADSGVI